MKELGFVKAAELSEGDILTDSKGGEMPIEFIKTETTDSPVTVYNFQVEDYHTYYVSDTGLLVHNAKYSNEVTVFLLMLDLLNATLILCTVRVLILVEANLKTVYLLIISFKKQHGIMLLHGKHLFII